MKLVFQGLGSSSLSELTILVCCYNQENLVKDCLDSINDNAELGRIELIIIDDGSRDETLARLLEYPFDPQLSVRIYTKPNGGLVESLRLGLAETRSAFFCLIGGDDFYANHAIDKTLGQLKTMPGRGARVFQCGYATDVANYRMSPTRLVYDDETTQFFNLLPAQRYEALCLSYPKPLLLQSAVFATELLRDIGAWSDGIVLDDWPTFLRIAAAEMRGCASLEFVSDLVISHYRVHAGGQHANPVRFMNMCLEVARNVVPLRYRARCVSFIYSEVSVMFLAQRRPWEFLWCWWRSFTANPGPATVVHVPALTLALVWKRIRRSMRA